MENKAARRAVELCGAVIGAGFASGREISTFFARFGAWSWLSVAAAVAVLGWLCAGLMCHPGVAGMPRAWQGRPLGKIWQGMFAALLLTTGGAMLAGGGEVAALLLPFHGARWLGLAASLWLGWRLSAREATMLPMVSKGLIACLAVVMLSGLLLPLEEVVMLPESGGEAIVFGLCYGGFNMALAAPVAAMEGDGLSAKERNRCVAMFTAVCAMLLFGGNGVLLRQGQLQGLGMPFMGLMSAMGRGGYVLGGAAMYLAALTTLAACMKGLQALLPRWRNACLFALAALSLLGLEDIVGVAYPLLGGGCFLLLVASQVASKWNKNVN